MLLDSVVVGGDATCSPPYTGLRANVVNSLTLAAYIYGLDSSTTYFYLPFATSSFSTHSLLSSIEVAAQVIRELNNAFLLAFS
jgi:hypothetical protein